MEPCMEIDVEDGIIMERIKALLTSSYIIYYIQYILNKCKICRDTYYIENINLQNKFYISYTPIYLI